MRLLVAEDDAPLATFIRKGLEAEHYAVDVVENGQDAIAFARTCSYDAMTLDINMPILDGFSVLQTLRLEKLQIPIIVVTARGHTDDRVRCLDSGADDVLCKPFSFHELSARVRALLRRGRLTVDTVLSIADLQLDRVERRVARSDKRLDLTSKEFALLEYLMRNAGRTVTRNMIIEHVWNMNFDTGTNVIDVYINYLRRKVDDGFAPKLIHTVRGVGYELNQSGVSQPSL